MGEKRLLESYMNKSDFISDYSMCKAFFKESNLSVMAVVERVLCWKYDRPWQKRYVRQAIENVRGQRDPYIDIPRFRYKEKVSTVFKKFIKEQFSRMLVERNTCEGYPIMFKHLK